jgi:hypothetical protein
MSNTFITPSVVARDAAIMLEDNMVAMNLVNRSHENKFAGKIGQSLTIKVPPVMTAADLAGGSTSASDVTETSVTLTVDSQPYVRADLTTIEKTMELDDFNTVVTMPAVLAIRDWIDSFVISETTKDIVAGLNFSGACANELATIADIVAGRKILQDDQCPPAMRNAIITTGAEANLLQLDQFTSADYGLDGPTAVREATIGRRYGFGWFADQNAGNMPRGDVAGTVMVKTTTASGTSLPVDDFTAATGTVYRGTQFTIQNDATIYTVTVDATIASNETILTISPTLADEAADTEAITFLQNRENIAFHKMAVAAAVVAPTPLSIGSSVAFYNGVGIRVTMSSSTVTLSDSIVFDTFIGLKMVRPQCGVLIGS